MAVRQPSAAALSPQDSHLRVVPTTDPSDLLATRPSGLPTPAPVPHTEPTPQATVASWPAALAAAQDRMRAASGQADALLTELVSVASSLVDAPASACLVENGGLIRKAWTAGAPGAWDALGAGRVGPVMTDGTICGEAVRAGRVIRTGALDDSGVGLSAACCPGARSHLAIPLVEGDSVLALLSLTSDHRDWFDGGDESAVSVLAGVAARALAGVPMLREQSTTPPATVELHQIPRASLRGLGMWSWDAASGRTTCSPSVVALLGLQPEENLTLEYLRAVLHPEDLPRFEAALTSQLAGGPGSADTFRITGLDGERLVQAWVEVRRSERSVVGAWGAVVDVTERERQAAALRSSLAGLRAAQELTGLGVWEWHPHDGRLEWSPEVYKILGLEPDERQPSLELWRRFVHVDDRERAMRLYDLGGDAEGGTVETFRVIGMDGVQRHVQSWSTVIPATGTSSRAIAGAIVDVTRQVRDRMALEQQSSTDPVTGLANRMGFDRRMQLLLADDKRDVGLLLLDLDRFKLVNDSLGHQIGDRLLVDAARRLQRVVPTDTLTARMGGDEFVIVPPPGLGDGDLRRIAQGVVEALRMPYSLGAGGEVLVCPVSVGVTSTAGREVDVDQLLSEADLALYRAKDTGRDRYVVFDDALRERARERHRAEQLLRAALEEDRLVLQYQPIVDFTHGRVVGAEALVRMRAEDGVTLLPPDTFVGVAEDVGLVVELDCWVLETALNQLARWLQHAPPALVPWLAVNVSPRSMEHPRIVRSLLDGLQIRGLPTHLIKVELTESSFLTSLPGGETALRQLMRSQIPVGIDDFGTGYSALAYLARFNLDFMKIDRSFVNEVGTDSRADAVATAIVALAHAHGMKVTAEGIETPRQARRLREIGCDFAQGYHFGRPGDASRILRG